MKIIKQFKKFESEKSQTIIESTHHDHFTHPKLGECFVVLDDAGDVQWIQLHMGQAEIKELEERGFYVDKHPLKEN